MFTVMALLSANVGMRKHKRRSTYVGIFSLKM
jgi:hypothetical protein